MCGRLSPRGCASLTPGCVLAPFQGACGVDDCLPGVALRLSRAVFWRPFRAYVSETPNGVMMDWGRHSPGVAGGYSREPLAGFIFPTPNHQRPRLRASIPPRERSHICLWQMSIPPRQRFHICLWQMSIPPRHLWRGGGRQAGGEVRQAGGAVNIAVTPSGLQLCRDLLCSILIFCICVSICYQKIATIEAQVVVMSTIWTILV